MKRRQGLLARQLLRKLPSIALAILVSASCSPKPVEPVIGTWTLTGPLIEPRFLHTLTVLADGRVLAAGGCRALSTAQEPFTYWVNHTAEIYDPFTGIWAPTGSMNVSRAVSGAVLLGDGRVLVAGGWDASGMPRPIAWTTTAELYDPATGIWTYTGEMACFRDDYGDLSLVLLPTGKVLFVGGYERDGSLAATAEVYDPATGVWERTGPLVVPRANPTAILLPSGKVLAVGGTVDFSGSIPWGTPSAELYDPRTNTWEETGSVGRPVILNTLALLPNGEVLLTNGSRNDRPRCSEYSAETNVYEPATGQWRSAHAMINPHTWPSAVRLPSGRVLVAGGNLFPDCLPGGVPSEVYDPWRDAWTPTPAMRHYRFAYAAAVPLPSGKVLFTGGVNTDLITPNRYEAISAVEIFDEGPLLEVNP